jgi:hypothetical protein
MWQGRNMTTSAIRLAIACGSLFLTIACANSTTSSPSAPSTTTYHAELTDPTGDAVASPGFPNTPDLVHGTVDVSGATIAFNIQLAPGTLDRSTTRVGIALDTDQTSATGLNAWGIGVDYLVDMWAPSNQVTIARAVPTGAGTPDNPYYVNVGTAPLSIVADNMTVTVSLSLLGNASGRLNYRVFAYSEAFQSPISSAVADVMPNLNLPAAHVP